MGKKLKRVFGLGGDPDGMASLKPEYLVSELRRLKSEFDNYRRRVEHEKADLSRKALSEFIESLLPVYESLEKACSADASASPELKAYREGFLAIRKQFAQTLQDAGIRRIQAMGKAFNPEYHHAVHMVPPTPETPEGTIVEVVQEGYVMGDSVLRTSQVVVAGGESAAEPAPSPEPGKELEA